VLWLPRMEPNVIHSADCKDAHGVIAGAVGFGRPGIGAENELKVERVFGIGKKGRLKELSAKDIRCFYQGLE
jgi:hypothetical protein